MIGKKEDKRLSNTAEEIDYLRENITKQEKILSEKGKDVIQQEIIRAEIIKHSKRDPDKLLSEGYVLSLDDIRKMAVELDPEEHDRTIMVLLDVVKKKGIRNALMVVESLKSPRLEEDFQRALVQYVKKNIKASVVKSDGPVWNVKNMTLYEVFLPEVVSDKDKAGSLKELVSTMDQFYSGMLSVGGGKKDTNHFTVEIVLPEGSHEIIFYVSVPTKKKDLFEKHMLSVFPDSHLKEQKNDYDVFVDGGDTKLSYGAYKKDSVLPIKMYDEFDYDPLNTVLNAFSKIEKEGGAAALQLVFKPTGTVHLERYNQILFHLGKGKAFPWAVNVSYQTDFYEKFVKVIKYELFGAKEGEASAINEVSQMKLDSVRKKVESRIVDVNIRAVASAKTSSEASDILTHIESSFNQFEQARGGNSFKFIKLSGKKLRHALYMFTTREYYKKRMLAMSVREISTIMHFPGHGIKSSPQFKQLRAKTAPAPLDLPQEGTLIGVNSYRGIDTKAYLTPEDRLRHFYVIGQTGTGKTVLLKNMIIQDIRQGNGVCMIDPHGNDIVDVLGAIPQERYEDVIYFDPGYTKRAMGLNMLEFDPKFPEQKTFVINELFSIFQKLYGAVPESMGPMFEQYFRNATALVLEDPESGSTLLDVSRVLSDAGYREYKLSKSKNPVVNQFWNKIAIRAGGEQALENIVPYITSKFDVFLANEIMRPVVGQEKSSFNFREVMDTKKILLVNLSKGRLGDINSNLIGLVLVGKILMAALSRVDSEKELPIFYLYIDEFQNITTNSISTILSEARKFNLSLTLSHQYISQLQDDIKKSVFGNVGSIASFRVGSEDGEFLEKQFAPEFSASDLVGVENYNAYVRILARGTPTKPFSIRTLPPIEGNKEIIEELKRYSYERYGQDREAVEKYILSKYTDEKLTGVDKKE